MSMGSGGIFGNDPDAMFLPKGGDPFKRKRGPLGLLEGGEDYEAFMPKVNQNDQSAINEYASAPEQKGLLSFWQGGEKFGGRDALSGLLMAVGDAFDREGGGEGGSLNAMIGGRAKAMADAQAAAKKSAEREQLIDAGVAAGRTREQMNLILGGAADYGDFKPAEAPSFLRDAQAFNNLAPQEQAMVTKFMDLQNPRFTNTPAGTQYIPRTMVPQDHERMTDEEIRAMGLNPGGPTQPASGRFR